MKGPTPIQPLVSLHRGVVTAGARLWLLGSALLISAILTAVAVLVTLLLTTRSAVLTALAGVSAVVLAAVLALGFVRLSLRIHDGRRADMTELFAGAEDALGALAAWAIVLAKTALAILPSLIVAAIATVLVTISVPSWVAALAGLTAALALFGALYSIARYVFVVHVIADSGAGPVAALRTAAALTNGRRFGAAVLLGLLALLNVLGACAAAVGLLLTIPVSMAALTDAYRTLVPAHAPLLPTCQAVEDQYRYQRTPA